MTENEHLLSVLAEECCEVAKEVSKALRFGLDDKPPGQPDALTTAERIANELGDLMGIVAMLQSRGILGELDATAVFEKKAKVEKFMLYARERGTIS